MSLLRLTGRLAATACSVILLLAAPTLAADAGSAPERSSVRQACSADFTKFCAGQDPRSETGRTCMREHRAQFSDACRGAMETRRDERRERIKTACATDIAKFCGGGAQNDERPGRCLRDHATELSDSCKAAFPRHHE